MSCKFNDLWLTDERFSNWLSKKNEKAGWCKVCCMAIDVTNLGLWALTRHHAGKKHMQRLPPVEKSSTSSENITHFFAPPAASTSKETPASHSKPQQTSIVSMIENHMVVDAEIRLSLMKIENKFSFRTVDALADTLPAMFPDSAIAKGMKMKKDKCGYVVKHAIAPYCEHLLLEQVSRSPVFALSFDESANKHIQKGQMDFIIRFWDDDKEIAQSRYLTSEFMGEATADDIMDTFNEAVSKKVAKPVDLLQISSDGPNVNLKFLKEYTKLRDFNQLPPLLDIGTCGLHTVHGSMKAGEKATKWEVGKTLKAMAGLLLEYPSRRSKYEKLTETSTFPLPYCGHRWCENETCLERASSIWHDFIKYVKYLNSQPKSKQPGKGEGKQWLLLRQKIDDPLMPARMKLLEYVSSLLNEFLRGFQTDQPMVPFLCETLGSILRTILSMYINSSIMKKADNLAKLLNIKPDEPNNFKQKDLIDLGMGARLLISTYKKSSSFKQSKLSEFYSGAQSFLSSLVTHMMEKSPLAQPTARMASSLIPTRMVKASQRDLIIRMFTKLLEKLSATERITVKEGNDAARQYTSFLTDVVDVNREKFLQFDKFVDRVDSFFKQFMVTNEYKEMWKVCKIVFILFHGQSAIERGFNLNKMTSEVNMKELTLTSLRMVDDHMKSHSVSAATFPVTTELRKLVATSRKRADEEVKKKSLNHKETEKQLKRKVVTEEIDAVLKKKMFLEEAIQGLSVDRDKYALEAAEKKDFQLLQRSNDLRTTIEAKKKEVVHCEEMEKALVLRKAAIL